MTAPELLAALTLVSLSCSVTLPALSASMRFWKLDAAARDVLMQMHRTRMEAVTRGIYVGILFKRETSGDTWRMYLDSGTQGIRSAEIAAGTDAPLGMTQPLTGRYTGLRFGIPLAAPPGVPRIPPAGGMLTAGDDPIAFGGSDIFSASPTGETSAGTVYITDGRDMRAVVAYGPTGRLRVWRYDGDDRRWRP